jgi:hypothetical protein
MSEAEKRARLTVAYDAIQNLLKNSNAQGLTRKEIFIADTKRQTTSTRVELITAMAKKPWQQELLRKLREQKIIFEEKEHGQTRYQVEVDYALRNLIEDVEDEGDHVFDANLRLSALLWPRDVILPEAIQGPRLGLEAKSEAESESASEFESKTEIDTVSIATEEIQSQKGDKYALKTLLELNISTSTEILKYLKESNTAIKESIASSKARQSETEKTVAALNSSVQGLLRTVKEQLAVEITAQVIQTLHTEKIEIVTEVRSALNPFYEQSKTQVNAVLQLIQIHKQTQDTRYQDLAAIMRRLTTDMEAATAMFMDVMEEKEASNGKS